MSVEKYVVRFVEGPPGIAGKYLKNYDPHFQPNPGKPQERSGMIAVSTKKEDGHLFPDPMSAWLCYYQTSNTFPTRADGKPNRPATAYTMEIIRVKI